MSLLSFPIACILIRINGTDFNIIYTLMICVILKYFTTSRALRLFKRKAAECQRRTFCQPNENNIHKSDIFSNFMLSCTWTFGIFDKQRIWARLDFYKRMLISHFNSEFDETKHICMIFKKSYVQNVLNKELKMTMF